MEDVESRIGTKFYRSRVEAQEELKEDRGAGRRQSLLRNEEGGGVISFFEDDSEDDIPSEYPDLMKKISYLNDTRFRFTMLEKFR